MTVYFFATEDHDVRVSAERWVDARTVAMMILGCGPEAVTFVPAEDDEHVQVEVQWVGMPPDLIMELRQRDDRGAWCSWVDAREFAWRPIQ